MGTKRICTLGLLVLLSSLATTRSASPRTRPAGPEAPQPKRRVPAGTSVQPAEKVGPSWRYLVEKTTVARDRLARKGKEKTFVERAFVYYGAGARQAGGQIKSVPQVVYIDAKHKRLPKAKDPARPIIRGHPARHCLGGELPEGIAASPEKAWAARLLAATFDVLPTAPNDQLRKGLAWTWRPYLCYGVPGLWFRATIRHEVTGYERRRGRMCAVIKYTVAGHFKAADHPERFRPGELLENRGEFRLRGFGTAHFDPEAGIVVEKEQAVSHSILTEKLTRLDDGKVAWVRTKDREDSVNFRVLLQPRQQLSKD